MANSLFQKNNKIIHLLIVFLVLFILACIIDKVTVSSKKTTSQSNQTTSNTSLKEDFYISKKEEIPDNVMNKMLKNANDAVSSYVAANKSYMLHNWDLFPPNVTIPDNADITQDITPEKMYIGIQKGNGKGNMIVIIYKAKITNVANYNYMYFPVIYTNIMLTKDNECKSDLSKPNCREYHPNSDFDNIYTNYVVSKKNDYEFNEYSFEGGNN